MFRRTPLISMVLTMALSTGAYADRAVVDPKPPVDVKVVDVKDNAPVIQVALLLDTSNSMDGLINQARTQLWKIVNQFNRTRHHGQMPKLQVALYEYGNNGLAAGEGYIRMVLPLTTDLDLVSEKLWDLKTNGGSEYCGQVIHNAVKELDWNTNERVYRAIFIAGNEPFTQGQLDYHRACSEALGKGIIINTIHCGPEGVGREGRWDDGAKIGEGRFLNIDQDRACVAIPAPQDDEIAKLSLELNRTYVPYGSNGFVGQQRQVAQDLNALNSGVAANSERAASKSGTIYSNGGWDLVDARKENRADLSKLKDAELPKEMQGMSPAEREKYISDQAAKRAAIQEKIAQLANDRVKFISDAQKKQTSEGADTFDSAVLKAVAEQMEKKDFKIEDMK